LIWGPERTGRVCLGGTYGRGSFRCGADTIAETASHGKPGFTGKPSSKTVPGRVLSIDLTSAQRCILENDACVIEDYAAAPMSSLCSRDNRTLNASSSWRCIWQRGKQSALKRSMKRTCAPELGPGIYRTSSLFVGVDKTPTNMSIRDQRRATWNLSRWRPLRPRRRYVTRPATFYAVLEDARVDGRSRASLWYMQRSTHFLFHKCGTDVQSHKQLLNDNHGRSSFSARRLELCQWHGNLLRSLGVPVRVLCKRTLRVPRQTTALSPNKTSVCSFGWKRFLELKQYYVSIEMVLSQERFRAWMRTLSVAKRVCQNETVMRYL